MRKSLPMIAAAAALLALPTTRVQAQVALGYTDVGAVIGLGNIGEANVAIGGRFERIFRKLPDLADGLLGVSVSADVYSWSGGGAKFRYIPIGATANYHFKLDPKYKLDAFLGAGLGFSTASCTLPQVVDRVRELRVVNASVAAASSSCGGSTGLYVIGRAGGRYFLTPKTTVYADLGAGAATINIGLTRRIR